MKNDTAVEMTPEEQAVLETSVLTCAAACAIAKRNAILGVVHIVLGKEVTRKLKVEIDDPTLSAFGNELADSVQKLEQLEDDKKASANGYKCQIDSASARARELANLIRAKCRYLDVTCREERDFISHEFILRRLDTLEAIERRPLRDDEKQAELVLDEEGRPDLDDEEPLEAEEDAEGTDAPAE